ncbi:hypothetical protein MMC17_002554 [Xylographa soralifera]|nr:hypothetical protein [Xylographa soralifera]
MERVVNLISRCTVYELLYLQGTIIEQSEKNLENALISMYITILRFLATVKRLYQSSTQRVLHGFLDPDLVIGFVNKCQELEIILDIEAGNCERVISKTAHIQLVQDGRRLKLLLDEMQVPLMHIDVQVTAVYDQLQESERQKILEYLSSISYEANHYAARDGRTKGTGRWILEHQRFREWQDSDEFSILWLYGIPGAGKTKLVSTIVDDTLKGLENDEVLAYFYCNRNESDRQNPKLVLSSFVRQLSVSRTGYAIHHSAVQLYKEKERTGFASGELTIEESQAVLIRLSQDFRQTTLILDAMDECDKETRDRLMSSFDEIVRDSPKSVKVFISSRPDQDIKHHFEGRLKLAIEAMDNREDIATFCNHRPKDGDSSDALREKSRFQWAALQIAQLFRLQRESDIRNRLGKLPKTLDKAYDEIYDEIQAQEGSFPEIANRAFQWVMCAESPLSTVQLVAAVCQDPDTDGTDPVDIDLDDVLAACRNLLIVDQGTDICQFSHLSVQEYLEKHQWISTDTDSFVATVCICLLNDSSQSFESAIYFSVPTWGRTLLNTEYTINNNQRQASKIDALVWYAMNNWAPHVRRHNQKLIGSRLTSLLVQFLGSMHESGPAYRRCYSTIEEYLHLPTYLRRKICSHLRPFSQTCFAVCTLGLHNILSMWQTTGFTDVNQRNENGETLLQLASEGNHLSVVQKLLEMGADVNAQIELKAAVRSLARYADALQAASGCGHEEVARLLLRNGANINGTFAKRRTNSFSDLPSSIRYSTALEAASGEGQNLIIQLLLDNGANLNACTDYHSNPVTCYHSNVHKCYCGNALQAASFNGHEVAVRILLENGAEINMLSGCSGTALHAAAASWKDETGIVTLLLQNGAAVNAQDSVKRTALVAAVLAGNIKIAALPVRSEADIHMRFGKGVTTLQAVFRGLHSEHKPEMAKLLLEHGAEVNTKAIGGYGTPLQGASRHGAEAIVRLILKKGADINASGGPDGTALQAAALHKHRGIVQLLLENGADVNAEAGHNTALQTALSGGFGTEKIDESLVRMLIDKGADVNAHPRCWTATPLQMAALSKNAAMVELLLENGAEINVEAHLRS